jgi:probable F420-dependent oxidoreductase
MRFWQSLFLSEAEQLLDLAKIAEELGFDGVMISDHLLYFEQMQLRYPYSEDGKPPFFTGETVWPECWSLIAGMAATTERICFITNVYIVPLRNPIQLAKAISSVGTFFGGRVILGAGAGWMKEEFDALGVDFHTRGKRFDECIAVLRKLWTGDPVEHRGDFFEFPRAQMCPVPSEPVPIYIGGATPAALRRTARLGDGWLGTGQTVEDALETLKRIDALRAEAGRTSQPFDAVVPLNGPPVRDDVERLRDGGAGGAVSLPFAFTLGLKSTLEQKRAYMERYANDIISKMKG